MEIRFDPSQALAGVQTMVNGFLERLPYILFALLVFALFFWLGNVVRGLARRIAQRLKKHQNVGLVIGRLAQSVVIFIGLLVALVIAIPTFTPGQLVNVLGLSSVAIGFAFRDILQNFLAGILILLSEPFRIGDQIVIGNFEGTVREIQTRATMIETYDGRRVVIPNSKLFTDSVTVNTANEKRRLQYDFGVGFGDDIARAKELLLQSAREAEGTLETPAPDALVVDLAESAVMIRLRWWIAPPRRTDELASRDEVLTRAKTLLSQEGIDLPFSTQVVLWHDQTDEWDGDRSRQREGWPKRKNDEKNPKPARIADVLRERLAREERFYQAKAQSGDAQSNDAQRGDAR